MLPFLAAGVPGYAAAYLIKHHRAGFVWGLLASVAGLVAAYLGLVLYAYIAKTTAAYEELVSVVGEPIATDLLNAILIAGFKPALAMPVVGVIVASRRQRAALA